MNHGTGKTYTQIKPVCVQHDCDKCRERDAEVKRLEELVRNTVADAIITEILRDETYVSIMEKMVRLMEIEGYSFKGESNWREVGTLAREVNQLIRRQQS